MRNRKKLSIFAPLEQHKRAWAVRAFSDARRNAARRGISFGPLLISDIPTPDRCLVFGIFLDYINIDGLPARGCSPTLDRLDPRFGFTSNNILVYSYSARSIRARQSVDDLRREAREGRLKWVG